MDAIRVQTGGPAARRCALTAIAVLAAAAGAFLAPPGAGAATDLGSTFAPGGCSRSANTIVQVEPAYQTPAPGVITSWSFQAPAAETTLRLKLADVQGINILDVVGQSTFETVPAGTLGTFSTRIPVGAGSYLGFYVPGSEFTCVSSMDSTVHVGGDVQPESTPVPGSTSSVSLDVSATLEPDCDSDGFGDETQDPDITSCAPPPASDTAAPDTSIVSGPKDKTSKTSATFTFQGTDARAVQGFQCSIDDAPFSPCTSPFTVKVRKGKHTFSVRAIDQAGNVDATPATDDWKVKKKKGRK